MRFVLAASLLLSILFVSGAASCGGTPSCSPQNCRTGCCTDTGVCVAGGENAACGSAGNACVNCAAVSQICGDAVCVSLSANGGGAGGDGGGDGGTGGGSGDGGTFTCDRTPVECSDQAIQQLDLKSTVAAGQITTVADGAGFKSTINATGGGFPPTDSYVYARFTANGLEKLPLSDMAGLDSMDWDIAFRRYVIRINGDDSGPSCVAAEAQPVGTSYDSVTAVPATYLPEGDDFLTRAPTCAFVDDGSGLGSSPRTYLSSFYQYTGCVAMTGRVYVIRTHTGRHVKLIVDTYYATEAAQTACDTSGSPTAAGGTVRTRWQYLD